MRNKIFLAAVAVLILLLGGGYLEEKGHKSADKGFKEVANTRLEERGDTQAGRFNTCSILYGTFEREDSAL